MLHRWDGPGFSPAVEFNWMPAMKTQHQKVPLESASPSVNSSRRNILTVGVLGGVSALVPRAFGQGMSMGSMPMNSMSDMGTVPSTAAMTAGVFSRRLPIPPQLIGTLRPDGVRAYELKEQLGHTELLSGISTPTWGYNGSYLGPTLRIPQGHHVSITVDNALDQVSTTHWHGAHVPGIMDGGPHSTIEPGKGLQVHFTLRQPAATLWYHPHPHMRGGPQVWGGLAGLFLVDDGMDAKLGLPHRYGIDDIPVILQDRRLDAKGHLLYMNRGMADLMGMKGDHFLVNGCEQPFVDLPAQAVRLRLLNGSNARVYNLAFADARSFHVIASDAGLLTRPVELSSLVLAPAERAEILVDLSGMQGKLLTLRSDSGSIVPSFGSSKDDSDAFDYSGFELLQIRVVAPAGTPGHLVGQLVDIEKLAPTRSAPRTFSLQGMSKMTGMSGMSSNTSSMTGMNAEPRGPGGMSLGIGGLKMFSINHQYMEMSVINEKIHLGDTELWEVSNDAEMAHPFHVHSTSFQIVSRNGKLPPEQERGWKDVVLVRRNETVRLLMRFNQPADAAYPFMYHCHILEHEDNGMMGQFTVT